MTSAVTPPQGHDSPTQSSRPVRATAPCRRVASAGCHSLDYIIMNSPFPSAALWDAEVTKMIRAFGAPISEDDAKVIAEYLKSNYGS